MWAENQNRKKQLVPWKIDLSTKINYMYIWHIFRNSQLWVLATASAFNQVKCNFIPVLRNINYTKVVLSYITIR